MQLMPCCPCCPCCPCSLPPLHWLRQSLLQCAQPHYYVCPYFCFFMTRHKRCFSATALVIFNTPHPFTGKLPASRGSIFVLLQNIAYPNLHRFRCKLPRTQRPLCTPVQVWAYSNAFSKACSKPCTLESWGFSYQRVGSFTALTTSV
jgi:hypothetical protein